MNKKTISMLLVVALVATLLPVVNAPVASAAEKTSFTEVGTISESADKGVATTTLKTAAGKEVKFVVYDNGDFDFSEGSSSWSYRIEPLTGVIAVVSVVNGNTRNMTGYRQANGNIEVYNYGHLVEVHNYTPTSWSVKKFSEWTGESVGAISKTLVKGSSMIATETEGDIKDVFPNLNMPTVSTAPTATPVATATPATTPTTTPSVTPTVAPTATPTTSPSVSPSADPSASPEVSPSANPTASPTTTAAPTKAPAKKSVTNISSLKHKTKLQKKAYSSLKSLEKLAKRYKWNVKREYTRKSSSKKKVTTTVYYIGDFGGKYLTTFKFTHITKKVGKKYKISYRWNKKAVSASGVKKVIKRKIK